MTNEIKQAVDTPTEKRSTPTLLSKISDTLLKIVAPVVWLYIFIKLFVFDIDNYLINTYFPGLLWIINYKFFIYLGLISFLWLLFNKNGALFWSILYIIAYPLILLIWTIPKYLFKQRSWLLLFTVLGFIFSFFQSLRFNFITISFFLISIFIILQLNSFLIIIPLLYLIVYLSLLYVRSIYYAFNPITLFSIQQTLLSKAVNFLKKTITPKEDIKGITLDKLNEQQLATRSSNIQMAIIVNRICYVLASKMREFQQSKVNVAFYIINISFLILITTLCFTFINYGLFRLDQTNFSYENLPNLFGFFYFSFNRLFFSDISFITAHSPFSQLIVMLEILCSIVIFYIIFTLVTTVTTSKHDRKLDEIIGLVKLEGKNLDIFVQETYQISIIKAMEEMQKIKAGFVGAIYYLTNLITEEE